MRLRRLRLPVPAASRWLAAAVLAAIAASTTIATPARAEGLLTLAVSKSPLSLPLYVADAEGLFAAEGLQVKLLDCVGGQRCQKLMFDGQADVATVGNTSIMFTSFVRSDFVLIGSIASTTEDLKLISRADRGATSPRALAGRKVGVVAGTASQYFLDSFLLLHGVDPRSVEPVPMQPEAMQSALQTGQVDGVAVWEPYGYRIMGAMKSAVQVLPSVGAYNVTFNLIAHRRLAGTRDADLTRLLSAVARAEQLIREQPDRAKAVLRKRLATDEEFVRWVWPQQVFRLSLDQSLLKTLESEARWALRERHVTARTAPNYLPFLYRAPLMAVDPSAVGINR